MKFEDAEEYTWCEILEYQLGPRTRKLPLKQMLLYMRSCIIRPAQLQIFTFLSMYDSITTEIEGHSISLIKGVCTIPAGNIKVFSCVESGTKRQIFEYNQDYLLSPEDPDMLILKCKSHIPLELEIENRHKPEYKRLRKILFDCVSPYPTLYNAVEVTTDDILNDFAFQFSTSLDFCSTFK